MAAPMNLKLSEPSVSVASWDPSVWMDINQEIGGNPDFYPLTIKAAYVVGIIHGICQNVSCVLESLPAAVSVLPSYGIASSGVELLGRCLKGNESVVGASEDLRAGFAWLAGREADISDADIVMKSQNRGYTIVDLMQLRHFTAHGQATAKFPLTFDAALLEPLPALLANGLERYWNDLQTSEDLCNALAKANVLALRSWPVLQSWSMFERKADGTYESMTKIFSRLSWRTH